MKNKTIIKVLDKTEDILAGHWGQGAWFSHGNYCLRGALNMAITGDPHTEFPLGPHQTRRMSAAIKALNDAGPSSTIGGVWPGIISFNDRPGTTEAQVLSLIKEAKDRLRNE